MEAAGKVPNRLTETAYEGGTERTRLVPPSGLNPWETASASINVDFPEPFSPTKKLLAYGNLFHILQGVLRREANKDSSVLVWALVRTCCEQTNLS